MSDPTPQRWLAPYRWSIADGDRLILLRKSAWPNVEHAFVFRERGIAEGAARRMRRQKGCSAYRAVPVPFTGRG